MAGDSPAATTSRMMSSQQPGKATMSSRMSGKQEDDNQRRSQPPPKAWGSGVNPITQRANTPSQTNGVSNKSNSKPVAYDAANSNSADKIQDRHVQAISHAMGFFSTVALKDGGAYVGIPTATKGKPSDLQFVFQNVRTAGSSDFDRPQKSVAKPQFVGDGAQHVMTFAASQIAFFLTSDAAGSTRPAQGKGFMTDVEISGNAPVRERKLERWQAPSDSSMTFGDSAQSGDFDQFKVNEQKFGVKTTYNEEDYTTHIDRNSANYAERSARAARIAAEISGDAGSNAWNEQRGANDEGYDEEDLYSGVRRDATPLQSGQANRYVPPSRRSQQGTPKEATVDPAIVSAQAAQKYPATQNKQTQSGEISVPQKPAPEKAATTPKNLPTASGAASSSSTKPTVPTPIQTQQPSVASKAPAEVHAAFQQFAKLEKMKVQNHKHMKNQQDKAVKVNDLKKFALNFKLHTPVPKDLLPILAKDEAKQNEIVKKAQEQAEQNKKDAAAQKQKASAEAASSTPKRQPEPAASGAQTQKGQNQVPGGPAAPNTLGQRLESNRRQHQQQQQQHKSAALPPTLPINDNRQGRQASYTSGMPLASPNKIANLRGPPSGTSTKFNPAVTEFRPNPMAAQFKPASSVGGTTAVSSPSSHPVTRTITPVAGPTISLFREAKARDQKGVDRKPITWQIENLKTIKPREEESKPETGKESVPASIQQPFKQKVDWVPQTLSEDDIAKLPSYKSEFTSQKTARQPSYGGPPANHNARAPHHVQYPAQNGAPNMHSMQMHGQIPIQGQPHHYGQGHYEEHQMRPSQSVQSAYSGPSPRMHSAYPAPMAHGAQVGYPQGPYMNPPHGMPPRQYSNGPQGVPGPHMQPPMMMQQGPGGPYMPQPMMPMQPQPHPQYAVPQQMYGGPPQANGYPSPGRGAPAMMPSGSHQGHPQPYTPNGQYVQPHYPHPPPGQMVARGSFNGQPSFPQSPYQQHPYPARTPSHGYAQPHQQPAMMTPQGPSAQPVMANNDDAK